MTTTTCECVETSVLRAQGKPIPPQHSCGYVRRRNEIVRRCWQDAYIAIRRTSGESEGAYQMRVQRVAMKAIDAECLRALTAGSL